MNYILVLLTIIFTVIVARFILLKYNPQFVFLISGVLMLMIAALLTGNSALGEATTGNLYIDALGFISQTFRSNISGVGTIIMVVTGFSAYMKHINASSKLAYLAIQPLKRIRNKYIILSGIYVVGMLLKLVITSQAALALLLLSSAYPILIALGINQLTAASVISLICIDWGPNDGSTIFAADVVDSSVVSYFSTYQMYVVFSIVIVLALLIPFYYKYMDKKSLGSNDKAFEKANELENPNCPNYYVFLPILPLVIIFISSLFDTVEIDVVTANFIGLLVAFVIEFIRRSDRKDVPKDMIVVIKAMGNIFASVVSIIITASVFAEGINQMGGISIVAKSLASIDNRGIGVIVILMMVLITFGAAALMGSGAASWFAFGPLAPDIAAQLGFSSVRLVLPMQLGSAIGRGLSPVAGATIAIAGHAEQDTMAVVKRSLPLHMVALVVNIVVSFIITL